MTSKVLHNLATMAAERAANWLPVPVDELPDPETLGEIALLGSYSYSLPQTRRRLVRKRLTLEDGISETPTAISRDYIRLEYKHGPKATWRQRQITDNPQPVPNYADPRKFAHGYYVDIQAAYWSIMNIVGWNVDYFPGMWLSPGKKPTSFPFPDHKIARNCLVSAGRMSGIPRFDPRKLPGDPYDQITPGNPLHNMLLPKLIHDVLNSIATLCIAEGAIYANNDGVIAPSPQIAGRCCAIIADWGLTPTIKDEGPGSVLASGTYQVGTHRTANYSAQRGESPLSIVFPPVYAKWLQKEFSHFAAK